MSSEYLDSITKKGLVPQTLAITKKQLEEYVKTKNCLRVCEACGTEAWDCPSIDGVPGLFTLGSARDSNYASWLFQFNCENCGNTRFIGAGYVWAFYNPAEAEQA